MSYARDTAVPAERSQREIEQLVLKAGATSFYRGMDGDKAAVGFQLRDRRILFELPLPKLEAFATFKKNGRMVKAADWFQQKMFDQAVRAKWRALALTIKASTQRGFARRFQWVADQLNAQARAIAERRGVSLEAAAQEIITGEPAVPPKAPAGGCWVKCPECTRVGPFFVEEGKTIVFCAQCALGEDRKVRLVVCDAPPEADRG